MMASLALTVMYTACCSSDTAFPGRSVWNRCAAALAWSVVSKASVTCVPSPLRFPPCPPFLKMAFTLASTLLQQRGAAHSVCVGPQAVSPTRLCTLYSDAQFSLFTPLLGWVQEPPAGGRSTCPSSPRCLPSVPHATHDPLPLMGTSNKTLLFMYFFLFLQNHEQMRLSVFAKQ